MKLHAALGISAGDVVAFAGAGGKSGSILQVASELAEAGLTVLVVPTTKMSLDEARGIGPLVTSEDPEELRGKIKISFSEGNARVAAGSAMLSKGRVGGVPPDLVSDFATLADVLLVEADGSRQRPIKGTADHEPALPDASTLVVAVGNVDALGSPVDEEHVHRPALFSELTGVGHGQSITARAFAQALVEGSLAKVLPGARTAALITGVEPGRTMADASVVSRELWRLGTRHVVLTSIPKDAPTRVWVP
ncbi:selenium cofactor biosynthesis protein YqeC [Rubrobacter tropicus]|uniref:selenium cofactor biosynthesis protein YqeC n=1 Tax=Rubrobacter tropicus TaxID=2653851 RepID=UPI001408146C|nr:selenium cofactor biosynthesis protein YqeC [Rubrobacter tropicus]